MRSTVLIVLLVGVLVIPLVTVQILEAQRRTNPRQPVI